MTFLTGFFNYNHIMTFFIAAHCIGGKSLYRFIKRERETYRNVSKQIGVSIHQVIYDRGQRKDLFRPFFQLNLVLMIV